MSNCKIRFSLKAWAKLNYLMHKGDTEVGGFGILSQRKDELEVIDFVLVPQESTSASVNFDDDGYEDYIESMSALGMSPDRFMRVWIHTHPGNSASPSGTDERSWNETFGTMSWAIMFILARGGDTYCRLGMHTEFATMKASLDHEIDWTMEYPENGAQEEWDAEYKRCVKKPTPAVYTSPMGFRGHEGGYSWRPKIGSKRRAYNFKMHKDPDVGLIPAWMDDDQVDEWEVDAVDKNEYTYVGPRKKTASEAAGDQYYLTTEGLWEHTLEACQWVAATTSYQNLDKVDWELIEWYCNTENVSTKETDEWNLWQFFKARMDGEGHRQEMEDIEFPGA